MADPNEALTRRVLRNILALPEADTDRIMREIFENLYGHCFYPDGRLREPSGPDDPIHGLMLIFGMVGLSGEDAGD